MNLKRAALFILVSIFIPANAYAGAPPITKEMDAASLELPFYEAENLPGVVSKEDISLAASISSREDLERYFAYDLTKYGYVAVLVTITNNSDKPILIHGTDTSIEYRGNIIKPLSVDEVSSNVIAKVKKLFNNTGYGLYEVWNMFFVRLDAVGENFNKKSLRHMLLPAGDTVRAYVFFSKSELKKSKPAGMNLRVNFSRIERIESFGLIAEIEP
ncbi:MAG: hypothetical protein H8D54_02240 [Candidatus Omnitrophica bacterium]|nr:hypothetical protein [Candidatus Omnitrophota bacterium]